MDTLNSPAIAWIEGLIKYLGHWRSLPGWKKIIPEIEVVVKGLKYSYTDDVTPYVEKIISLLEELPVEGGKPARWVKYVKEEVLDLKRKVSVTISEPFGVFRYRFVEILDVKKHPDLDLTVTTVKDKDGKLFTVVTNRPVKRGQQALIVMLPPKEFGGIWSEGMFVKFDVEGPDDIDVEDLKSLNKYYSEVVKWK